MLDVRFQPMADDDRPPTPERGYVHSDFECRTKLDSLEGELGKLGATNVVIETGHQRTEIRNDGWPRGGTRPSHPDVRLYFTTAKHGTLKYGCACFKTWEDNLYAIALWLARQRKAIDEWGIGGGGEVYRGFAALPEAPGQGAAAAEFSTPLAAVAYLRDLVGWRMSTPDLETATLAETLINEQLRAELFRQAARKSHHDTPGGSEEMHAKVNRAKDLIEEHVIRQKGTR